MDCKVNIQYLHDAVEKGSYKEVKRIIEGGIDPMARYIMRVKPLYLAVLSENLKVIKYLVEKGASPYLRDGNGEYFTHVAARVGNLKIFRYFYGIIGIDLLKENDYEETSLEIAAGNGHRDIVKFILDRLEDSKKSLKVLKKAIDSAKMNGQDRVLELLMEYTRENKEIEGGIPEHAVYFFSRKVVPNLTGEKKEVDWNSIKNPFDKFIRACHEGDINILKNLLEKHGKGFIRDKNEKWNGTGLHIASRAGNLEVVRYLVDKGSDLYSKYDFYPEGSTPLHLAANSGALNVVKYFGNEVKMDLDVTNDSGDTPLHLAATEGNSTVVEYLVSRGININRKDNSGKTPLMLAIEHMKSLSSAKYLVESGAELRVEDKNGNSIDDYALTTEVPAIKKYIMNQMAL